MPESQKMAGSWMCAEHQSLGAPAGDQILVLLHCSKVVLDHMRCKNSSTFFSLVSGTKKKIYCENVHF